MALLIPRRWIGVVVAASVAKLSLIVLTPPKTVWPDFFEWIKSAQNISWELSSHHFASLVNSGAYLGLSSFIAPLFWFWTVLPIQHPSLTEVMANPSISYSLLLIMKLPLFLFDLITGLLIVRIVQMNYATNLGLRAFLSWYMNPYNWIFLYYYSTYDVIPTAIVTLAVLLALRGRWLQSGLCLSFAVLLRLYPVLIFPFFLLFASKAGYKSVVRITSSFVAPLILVLTGLSIAAGSVSVVITALENTPLQQYWLLEFYGLSISDSSIILTPFLLTAQLFLILFWTNKSFSLVHAVLASLLLTFAVSYHHGNHFLWTSPFLSIYYDLDHRTFPLYVLTYVCALFSPITYGGGILPVLDPYYYPLLIVVGALAAGAGAACKLFYVLQVNVKAIEFKQHLLGNILKLRPYLWPP